MLCLFSWPLLITIKSPCFMPHGHCRKVYQAFSPGHGRLVLLAQQCRLWPVPVHLLHLLTAKLGCEIYQGSIGQTKNSWEYVGLDCLCIEAHYWFLLPWTWYIQLGFGDCARHSRYLAALLSCTKKEHLPVMIVGLGFHKENSIYEGRPSCFLNSLCWRLIEDDCMPRCYSVLRSGTHGIGQCSDYCWYRDKDWTLPESIKTESTPIT